MQRLAVAVNLFKLELGRQAKPGRQTGIRLYWPAPAEEQKNPGDTGSQTKQLHIRGDI
jgi:hypothetical protein